jgi:fructokinase
VRLVSIGEVLWDVIGGVEHLGGAPFNFTAHAARLGHSVYFVSAVGKDERGQAVLERMASMGLSTRYVCEVEDLPTGVVTVDLDPAGVPRFTIHHPAAYDAPVFKDGRVAELLSPSPAWIYFGTLFQMSPNGKALTYELIDSYTGSRIFYDVNLRKDSYEPALVRELMRRAQVVKLNEDEAAAIDQMSGRTSRSLEDFCRAYAAEFGWESACITRGEKGCALLVGGEYVEAAGYPVRAQDTVGSGDAFAAALVHGLSLNWPPTEIADFANRLAALVASRPGAIPPWNLEEIQALTR